MDRLLHNAVEKLCNVMEKLYNVKVGYRVSMVKAIKTGQLGISV